MFNPIMEIDAMQFASMSREMLRGENFLHLLDNGEPYLDKPPLIFWVTGLFFKFFGASDFVYRLPSIFLSLITIHATYQFSRLYYSSRTALTAALILASCQVFFIMNADVRTDIYMIAPMMISIWKISAYFKRGKWSNLLIGSVAIGFAVMGKGPLGMLIPVFVLGVDLLLKRRASWLADVKLLWGVGVVALCLLPMSYGLFTQFGTDGLKFFYWTQSFGRITGASNWSNDTGPLYLLTVFLCAFMPWTILFVRAFYARTKEIFSAKKISQNQEAVSYAGFLIPLVMLSLSNYKLPHYIYCTAPFAAMVTARGIESWLREKQLYTRLFFMQLTLGFFLIIFMLSIIFYAFPLDDYLLITPLFLLLAGVVYNHRSTQDKLVKLLVPSSVASVIVNYSLNVFLMAPLLTFQAPSEAAKFLKKGNYNIMKVYLYQENAKGKSRSFNYYLDRKTVYIDKELPSQGTGEKKSFVYTGEKGYNALRNQTREIEFLAVFKHFRVSKPNLKFLNAKTRESVLEKKYLLMLSS